MTSQQFHATQLPILTEYDLQWKNEVPAEFVPSHEEVLLIGKTVKIKTYLAGTMTVMGTRNRGPQLSAAVSYPHT